jgi:integral membrane protein (TIGR01906 family)
MDTTRTNDEKQPARGLSLPGWPVTIMRITLVAALPLVLVLLNARLAMTNAFLTWEYNRPNFPDDPFGFTKEERLEYAPLALDYLFNDAGVEFLGDQTLPDGSPLYNERELSHMLDVKNVTQGLLRFGYGLVGVYALCVVMLALSPDARPALFDGLFWGSALTAALIVLGLLVTATSFSWLFTQFHALFFEGDTWIFPTSDTLIRLFPTPFWIDAFALVFGGTLVEALILGGVMRSLRRR